MMRNIRIKKLTEGAKMPVYSSAEAAGADLFAASEVPVTVKAGETEMIHCGIAIELPAGYVGLVCARSGLAFREGLAPANKVGVIDSDYRGEIMVAIHNHSRFDAVVTPGERIAQLMIMPVSRFGFVEAEELSDTGRGVGGFGSTGK